LTNKKIFDTIDIEREEKEMVQKNQKKADAKKQRAYFPVKMGTVSHKSPKWESRNTAKKNLKKVLDKREW
jgi:hypothetical protein